MLHLYRNIDLKANATKLWIVATNVSYTNIGILIYNVVLVDILAQFIHLNPMG